MISHPVSDSGKTSAPQVVETSGGEVKLTSRRRVDIVGLLLTNIEFSAVEKELKQNVAITLEISMYRNYL